MPVKDTASTTPTKKENTMPVKDTASTTPTKKVMVHGNDRENDEREIVIGVNGVLTQVQIGVEVELSNGVINAIKNASYEIDEHKLDKDGNPTKEKVKRKISRYIVEAV